MTAKYECSQNIDENYFFLKLFFENINFSVNDVIIIYSKLSPWIQFYLKIVSIIEINK
jgi:hypothetical protein